VFVACSTNAGEGLQATNAWVRMPGYEEKVGLGLVDPVGVAGWVGRFWHMG